MGKFSSIVKQGGLLLALLAGYQPVQAHEFWTLPHPAMTEKGSEVVFELRIGSSLPGTQTPRLPNLISSFESFDAQGKQDIKGHNGALVIGHLRPRVAGTTISALTTNPVKITLPADEFEQYLQEEGLTQIIAERKASNESHEPGAEIFSRCARSLIFVDNNSDGFDKITGLELELIPLTEPLHYQPNTSYVVKLLSEGNPAKNRRIKAQLPGSPPTVLHAQTDTNGEAIFKLPQGGEWLFSAVKMTRSDDIDADWQSLWASLTLPIAKDKSL